MKAAIFRKRVLSNPSTPNTSQTNFCGVALVQ